MLPATVSSREILIIDDHAEARFLARRILQARGAIVSEASDILSGLSISKSPSLILLDLQIPDLDGFEFLKTRKNVSTVKDVPIIVLSGRKDKAAVMQAIAMGAKDYIVKPFLASLLIEKIERFLSLSPAPSSSPELTFSKIEVTFRTEPFRDQEYRGTISDVTESGLILITEEQIHVNSSLTLFSDTFISLGLIDGRCTVTVTGSWLMSKKDTYGNFGEFAKETNLEFRQSLQRFSQTAVSDAETN